MASKRFVVGLTGGIGCGKSVVAEMLAALGAQIIDADQISHALSAPPSPALAQIAAHFGPGFLTAQGELDRNRMRSLAFSRPEARQTLESIFHPLILAEAQRQLATPPAGSPYAVLVAPLLFEVPAFRDMVQHTLVIDCPPTAQISRVQTRSGLSPAQIEAIMAAQLPREERLKRADSLICNDGSLTELREQIKKFHCHCLELAK